MEPETVPPLACACASLRRAARAVTQLYDTAFRESGAGLRTPQFTLLEVLEQKGSRTQKALGDLLALDATTLTRTLRPLARAGWIRPTPGRDRREVRWMLTRVGRGRLARARPAWQRAQARLRSSLRSKHWTLLIEDLAEVARAARQIAGDAISPP